MILSTFVSVLILSGTVWLESENFWEKSIKNQTIKVISEIASNEECPVGCRCEFVRQQVFCHNRGLMKIPLNIPRTTKMLYLQENMLSSTSLLDRELSKLTQLTRLMLYDNNLTRIPTLSSVHLEKLKIDRNKITRLPDNVLGGFWIWIFNHNVRIKWPKKLKLQHKAGTPGLVELDLTENELTSPNVSAVAFRPNRNLQILYLSRNKLTSFPPGLPSSLIQLSLSFNAINAISKRATRPLHKLETLHLDRNRLTDKSLEAKGHELNDA